MTAFTFRLLLRWICFTATVIAAAIFFWPAIQFSVDIFESPVEHLHTYGWLVPIVSGYAIWKKRAALREASGAPAVRGLAAIAGCLVLFWLGDRGGQMRLTQLAMIGAVVAIPVTFWGARVARYLLFPTVYLLFVTPASFVDTLTFRLQLFTSWVATALLNGVGLVVQQVGTALVSTGDAGFKLDLDDPCGGIRAIFALTAAYAYFTQKTALRQGLLFVSAVPIAIVGNVARIVSLALLALWMGQASALVFYYQYSRYLVFAVAVLLTVGVSQWLSRVGRAPPEVKAPVTAGPGSDVGGRYAPWLCALVPVLFTAGWLLLQRVPVLVMDDDCIASAEPVRVGGFLGTTYVYCQNPQCLQVVDAEILPAGRPRICPRCGKPLFDFSPKEKSILLPNARLLNRTYRNFSGEMLDATVVVSGTSRLSIHRPELCLPLQGFHILSNHLQTLDLGNGRQLRVRVVQAARAGEKPVGFIYWFVSLRTETASHWVRIFSDVWARAAHNRINRWSMITLFSDQSFDQPKAIRMVENFLSEWYPQIAQTNNIH